LRNKSIKSFFHSVALSTLLALAPLLAGPSGVSHAQGVTSYPFLENGFPHPGGSDLGYQLDSPTRLKIDLSGEWEFRVEGGPSGLVRVPAAYDFQGKVLFRRSFALEPSQLDRFRFHLVFLGVSHASEILVNGEFVTSHSGGYTTIVQEIPENILRPGDENVIEVRVSNALDPRTTVPVRQLVWGFRTYGGITRDVYLLGTPPVSIGDPRVTTELTSSLSTARIKVRAPLEGSLRDTAGGLRSALGFSVRVFEKLLGGEIASTSLLRVSGMAEGSPLLESELQLRDPLLWSPASPDLYVVRIQLFQGRGEGALLLDQQDVNIGIKRLEISGGDFLLNGKRLILNGVIWYEDHPTWGSALAYEERERDVVLLRNLGANAVRFMHHPPHPYMLNLCDRYGLLALVDMPVSRVPTPIVSTELFRERASTLLREVVQRDRNHVSVMAWGIADQCLLGDSLAASFVGVLASLARSLDGRPVYAPVRYGTELPDSATVEIAGFIPLEADAGGFASQLELWRDAHRGRPVVVSQFGSEVIHDNREGYSDPLSQQAQARYFLQRFDALRRADFDGAFVWSFNDWRGDRPALSIRSGNPLIHSMGLVSGRRERRLSYEAVRSIFRGEKFAALPMGSHGSESPIIYVLVGFIVLVGMAYFYNANRRFRESILRSLFSSYNFFSDVRDQHVVSTVHSTLLGVVVSIGSALVASSIAFHFRDDLIFDGALSLVLVSDGVKEAVSRLIRDPLWFMAAFTGFVMVNCLLMTLAVYLLRFILKTRIYFFHAYSITMWSTPPMLLFIPLGMILYRVMESSMYVIPAIVLAGAVQLWVSLRLLRGIAIIYDAHPLKIYGIALTTTAVALGVAYVAYDTVNAAPVYLQFLYRLLA